MPLYNNILLPSRDGKESCEKPKSSGSVNASMKLLQDHLMSKRKYNQQNTAIKTQKQTEKRSHDKVISEHALHNKDYDWEPEDEYDPRAPNSYELLQAEMIKAGDRQLAAKRSGATRTISNLLDVVDKLDEDDCDRKDTRSKGTAIAPPPSLASKQSAVIDTSNCEAHEPMASFNKSDCGSVAAKIMSKMGYKAGQGLGKDEQGISVPLEVESGGTNVGRILVPKAAPINPPQTPRPIEESAVERPKEFTRVILLQNMVGPGEVDEELEAETKEECQKYGKVVKCLIFEIPNQRVPDDQAVRIFVEFCEVESAIKAVADLNGRFFGGRRVKGSFYDVERFKRFELGPS